MAARKIEHWYRISETAPETLTHFLLRLADKLDGKGPYKEVGPVKEKNFNMGAFFNVPRRTRKKVERLDPRDAPCGTTACALGWAYTDRDLRAMGLDYRAPRLGFLGVLMKDLPNIFDRSINADDIWEKLFSGFNRRTPKEEARAIRNYVKARGWV